jgi:hypothetical protein
LIRRHNTLIHRHNALVWSAYGPLFSSRPENEADQQWRI